MKKTALKGMLLLLVAGVLLPSVLLVQRRRHDERIRREVFMTLQLKNAVQRFTALTRLGEQEGPATVSALLEALESPDAETRRRAADPVGSLSLQRDVPLIQARIFHLKTDPNARVREACGVGLTRIATPEVLAAFIQASRDSDVGVATLACGQLGERGGKEAIAALFQALTAPNWYVRFSACKALLTLKIADARVVAALEKMAHEEDARRFDYWMERARAKNPAIIRESYWGKFDKYVQQAKAHAAQKR